MTTHPTLAELRARVFKHSAHGTVGQAFQPDATATLEHNAPPEIGNWLARRVGRPAAVYGTWLAVRLGVSAHQVTLAALLAGLTSALAIATGSRAGFIVGVLLAQLSYWLDHVDGQVARWRQTAGLDGVYLDYLMHHAQTMALGFALGYGLAIRTGNPHWAAAGFLVALGWAFLGLQNDCRYKAFFQVLKKENRTYRVDGGAGGRPAPPAGWPRHGHGLLTWPLYKACEPHVVLVVLTALALLASMLPATWEASWRLGVVGMAVLAPMLALGRAARAIARGTVAQEFDRWFRPNPEP